MDQPIGSNSVLFHNHPISIMNKGCAGRKVALMQHNHYIVVAEFWTATPLVRVRVKHPVQHFRVIVAPGQANSVCLALTSQGFAVPGILAPLPFGAVRAANGMGGRGVTLERGGAVTAGDFDAAAGHAFLALLIQSQTDSPYMACMAASKT
jgi:hypothetical protein